MIANQEAQTEHEVREYIRENGPLLDHAGSSTLQRIIITGSNLSVKLSAESVEAGKKLTNLTNNLAAAIRDKHTSPKQIHALEVQRPALKKDFDNKSEAFAELAAFLDDAIKASEERDEPDSLPTELERKPSFLARLFRRA